MDDANIHVEDKIEPISPMAEINKAYEVCKFGRFHVKLLSVSFFAALSSILVTNTTSYLLPIAECDLNMNLKQKGLLTAMPYFGMFISTVIAGFLVDTFGRIYFLRIGFGGIFLCTLFSASSQTYEMLAAAKLCEGIFFATVVGAISSLTSEFCHSSVRDRVMLCQSSYAAIVQILGPAMAWGILIQNWKASFFDGRFVLNVWNFYLLAMSLWSLIAFLLYSTILPESPKYLITQKRYVEARNILIQIYSENSGKPADTFPSRFATSLGARTCLAAEFSHSSVRDRVMLCQSSFAAFAQILCPAMAWGILIQNWKASFFDGRFVLNVWNFYLLAMSLWSLTAFLLYSTIIPESPKYLVTQKRYVEARNVLIQMYSENSGKHADTFPYPKIFEKEIKEADSQKADDGETKLKFRDKIMTGLRNMKPLTRRPLSGYVALIALSQFITLGTHNVIRLWFPQLSTIVEHYNLDANQNLCDLLDSYTGSLKIKSASNATSPVCVPHVTGTETYVNSIIIGLVCILPYFISGVVVNKVGKKVLLFIGGVLSAFSLLGLRWSNSKTMMVAFFSTNIAVTQTIKSLILVVLIDVIPTRMRTLALSLVMITARMGTLVSNVTFPILLAMGCSIPFYTMAAMMSFVVLLTIFLPKKKD